ncbi:MAG: hypothetical protein HYX93_03175 [Chloroflexi bacterium]|nr:hypothetical protein [Chloroflexota bacterium]
MWIARTQFGLAEWVGLALLLVVVGLVALGVSSGWTIAIVPGLTYVVTSGAAYAVYRLHRQEKARLMELSTGVAESTQTAAARLAAAGMPAAVVGAVAFRVVGSQGTCLLGRRVGEVVTVASGGTVTPGLCPQAEEVLRMAASDTEIEEWCCPIYQHLLVFRRELQAAA